MSPLPCLKKGSVKKGGVSPSLKAFCKKAQGVCAHLNLKCCRKKCSLAFRHLISLKTNVFWGDEGCFSKAGCWTGFLPQLAKGCVSAAAGTGEREGAHGWEGGQSFSFFQQARLWSCRDCLPGREAAFALQMLRIAPEQ